MKKTSDIYLGMAIEAFIIAGIILLGFSPSPIALVVAGLLFIAVHLVKK